MNKESEQAAVAATDGGGVKKHEHTHKYHVDPQYEKRDFWRDFMHHSWKPLAATTYVIICLFDFVIVNIWIGVTRDEKDELLALVAAMGTVDVSVQIKMIDTFENLYRWEPMTLQYGGIFHFAMGSILTGVAITGYRGGFGSKPPNG